MWKNLNSATFNVVVADQIDILHTETGCIYKVGRA
jgi:hypothetical protein